MLIRTHSVRGSSRRITKLPLLLAMCLSSPVIEQIGFAGGAPETHDALSSSDDFLDFASCRSEDLNSDDSAIKMQEHSLLELVKKGAPFLKSHPANVMTAAQVILAMIKSQPMRETTILGYDGKVPVYSFFSKPGCVNGGRMIVGQQTGIAAVVDSIEAQASGSKTGVKVPLLVGTHGTGKTEFRTVIANALSYLTRHDPNFYMYEIVWKTKELCHIPDLASFIKVCQESEFRSPLHSSPVALLPEDFQVAIRTHVQDNVEALVGSYPLMKMELDPVSKHIRDQIMAHHHRTEKRKFSPVDEVKILDQYASMRRVILGEPGTVPLIDAQGEDVDYQGLFMSENPIFRMLPGSSNVWAWNYNGSILSGNRNLVFLDEFFRNEMALRDMFLGIFESRVVSHGGSPSVPVDAVFIAASNSANLDKAKADKKAAAQINRMRIIPFEWAVNPGEIAKIILYMNGKGIRMQKLHDMAAQTDDEASQSQDEYTPMDIEALFPDQEVGRPMLTPDGRYKLTFGSNEENSVFIAPHTLMFLADFIAATRMNTSDKDALAKKDNAQIIGDPMFRDPLTRLKVLKGEQTILPSQARELYKLSKRLHEGSFGLSARVAGNWFSIALRDAAHPENGHTLTPTILRKVYDRMEDEGALEIPDDETAIVWKRLMDKVAEGVLVPKLHNDVYSALHSDTKTAEIHDSLMDEILALNTDENATEYENRDGLSVAIERDRLKEIKAIYQKQTGRPLAYNQISQFYINYVKAMARSGAARGGKVLRNPELMNAINEYLASRLDGFISMKDLLACAEENAGGRDIKEKYRSLEHTLTAKGYNKYAIMDALRIIKQMHEKKMTK